MRSHLRVSLDTSIYKTVDTEIVLLSNIKMLQIMNSYTYICMKLLALTWHIRLLIKNI